MIHLNCAECGHAAETGGLVAAFEAGWRYVSATQAACPACSAADDGIERQVDELIEERTCPTDPVVLDGSLTIPDKGQQ